MIAGFIIGVLVGGSLGFIMAAIVNAGDEQDK